MKRARRGDGRQALVAALVGALVAISIAPLRARAAPFRADGFELRFAVNECLEADATGACDCSSPDVHCCQGDGLAIGSWDTSQVVNMERLFDGAVDFNQDISGWNTAAVTTMYEMFVDAAAFNQDISAWNTAAVTDAAEMFSGATAWNSKYERNDASPSTDGPPSAWSIRMCLADQRVVANACVSCPAGTTNAAGDLRLGTDTACDAAPLSNARTFTHAEIAGVVVGVVASIIVAVALCVRRRRLADDRLRARLGIPTHSAPVGFPPQEPQIIIVQR
jgi:surface protein